MNNSNVQIELTRCDTVLADIQKIVTRIGATNSVSAYLTMYAVIRACGCIEAVFKAEIADFCDNGSKMQVKRFISKRIREGSANPSMDNIRRLLKEFDTTWYSTFSTNLNAEPNAAQLRTSLQSLVDARNELAHGGNPTVSLADVILYFAHAKRIIQIIDDAIV